MGAIGTGGTNTPPPPVAGTPIPGTGSTSSQSQVSLTPEEEAKVKQVLDDIQSGKASQTDINYISSMSSAAKEEVVDQLETLVSNPQLPEGDQATLNKYVNLIKNMDVRQVLGDPNGSPVNLEGPPPPVNPYFLPSVQATLFPILADIAKIMNEIVAQSAKLTSNMMMLTLSMAKDAFNCAVEAGELRATMLRQDAAALFTQAAVAFGQAALTIGAAWECKNQEANAQSNLDDEFGQKYHLENDASTQKVLQGIDEQYGQNPSDPTVAPKELSKQELQTYNQEREQAIAEGKNNFENGTEGYVKDKLSPEQQADYNRQKTSISSEWSTKNQMYNNLIQQVGTGASSSAQATVDIVKAGETAQEALLSAAAQMLQQLSSTVQQTMQKADEAQKDAVQFLQSFSSLVQQISSSITQSLHS